jgi:hypothetical protein
MGHNGSMTSMDLREYVSQISKQLTERIEHQRDVLLKFVEESKNSDRPIDYCPLIDCRSKKRLKEGLREAVLILAETRQSFKSRRLEELRLKLEALLAEDPL